MSKASRRQAVAATIALLAERFPQAFVQYGAKRRPLKVGVHRDVVAALNGAIAPIELARALGVYCGNSGYLHNTRAGTPRIGLDGQPAGAVTAENQKPPGQG